MTTMVVELYDALKNAGADEEAAKAAAQAVLRSELEETLATKRDLKELTLKVDIQAVLNRHLQIQLALMIAMTGIFAAVVKLL